MSHTQSRGWERLFKRDWFRDNGGLRALPTNYSTGEVVAPGHLSVGAILVIALVVNVYRGEHEVRPSSGCAVIPLVQTTIPRLTSDGTASGRERDDEHPVHPSRLTDCAATGAV